MTDQSAEGKIAAALDRKTRQDEIEWRVMRAGKTGAGRIYCQIVPYRTARSVYSQLDEAVGKMGWNSKIQTTDKGAVCELSIKMGEQWVTKTDGAPYTDIKALKGAISDAHKRVAVLWGIGRDLYDYPVVWAEISEQKQRGDQWRRAKTKEGTIFWWRPPESI